MSFSEYVIQASCDGVKEFGMMALAIHTDADRETYDDRKDIIYIQRNLNWIGKGMIIVKY